MAEPEPTSTPTAVTAPGLHKSSPLKTLPRPVNPASRDEMAKHILFHFMCQISNEEMLGLLGRGQDRIGDDGLANFPEPSSPFPDKDNGRTAAICDYLDKIGVFVKAKEATTPWFIRFLEIPDNAPLGHPTFTQCRPDVAVIKQSHDSRAKTAKLYWSQLEATGEDESSGKSKGKAHAQGASYTGYLLLARPDYVSVPGIFFNATHFKLFLTNACQCYATNLIEWNSVVAQRLLYTWLWRLYHPEVDETIEIKDGSSGPPTFTVHTGEDATYNRCSILSTGGPFGRRTTVFDAPGVVIKEQFIEVGRRFAEGPILEKIHNNNKECFPGVVRVGWHGTVKSGGTDIELKQDGVVNRTKKRLVLLDKAALLMGAHTPREFLMALYDLLEITRTLWRKYKILHRDISPNNVLLRDESRPMTSDESLPKGLGDMCFSEYLLQAKTSLSHPSENTEEPRFIVPQTTAVPSSPHPHERTGTHLDLGRLSTRVVLIDFDMGEDQTPVLNRVEKPKDRTGTPIFMARAVRAGVLSEGTHQFHPMPKLDLARDVYHKSVGDRLQISSPDEMEFFYVPVASPLQPFRHKLRYDAEAVFWLFLWWSLQIKPKGKEPEVLIPSIYWTMLTNELDVRGYMIKEFPTNFLHPRYKPLEGLLKEMANQLLGDHGLLPSRQHDEYLHEAFQRLILEFMFANSDEPFMNLETHDQLRKVDNDPAMSQGASQPSSSKRKRDLGDEDDARVSPFVTGSVKCSSSNASHGGGHGMFNEWPLQINFFDECYDGLQQTQRGQQRAPGAIDFSVPEKKIPTVPLLIRCSGDRRAFLDALHSLRTTTNMIPDHKVGPRGRKV